MAVISKINFYLSYMYSSLMKKKKTAYLQVSRTRHIPTYVSRILKILSTVMWLYALGS